MTAVTFFTHSRDVTRLTEGPAVVAVDAAVVHVEETPARDALEVFRVPDLPEGLDGVLHS